MTLPSFTVTGSLYEVDGSLTGADLTEAALDELRVTFTPNLTADAVVTWDGAMYRLDPVVCQIASDGTLNRGGDAVSLVAQDDGLNIDGLQYECKAEIRSSIGYVTVFSFGFDAAADGDTVDLSAVSALSNTAAAQFIGTVYSGVPAITTTTLDVMTVGIPFSQQLTAEETATWSVLFGTLPAGLTLSSSGVLSGTPTTEEDFDFTVGAETV